MPCSGSIVSITGLPETLCFFYEVEKEICKNVKNDTKFFVWGNTFYKKNLLLIRKELTILK